MKPWWMSVVLLLGSFFLLVSRLGSARTIVFTLGSFALFALPGIFLGIALFGRRVRVHPEALIFGVVLGVALSGFSAVAVGSALKWSVPVILTIILALTLLIGFVTRPYWDRPLLPSPRPWERTDYSILATLGVIVIAFVTVPYLNVGKLTPDGYAYTWLFGFDFLLRSAFAASITLGVPPDYMHLAGHTLRYYLSGYTLPAFAYSASGKTIPLHSVLLVVTLILSLAFLACLFAFLRRFVSRGWVLFGTGIVMLVGYSYYGWYVLAKRTLLDPSGPLAHRLDVTKFRQWGEVSHLFQRLFLVEPQALAGLCVFLFVLFALELVQHRIESYGLAVVLGLALGLEFGIEGWYALVLVVWFALVQALRWARTRHVIRQEYRPLVVLVGVCGILYVAHFATGMYDFASRHAVLIRPYWWVMAFSPLDFPVEYGPMLLLGLWGLWRQWRRNSSKVSLPLLVLFGLISAHIFFVTAATSKNLGLMRGNRLLPIVLLVWTGCLFESLLQQGASRKARIVAFALVAAAIPTFFTDIHFASNVYDPDTTRYVRVADREACEWIRHNLPEMAIVQGEPDYIGRGSGAATETGNEMSLIANFAERRMVLGQYWIASTIIVNSEGIAKARYEDLQRMFGSGDIASVVAILDKYRIDYLYVGPYEQIRHPGFLELIKSDPACFQEVYGANGVRIFQWKHVACNPKAKSDAVAR